MAIEQRRIAFSLAKAPSAWPDSLVRLSLAPRTARIAWFGGLLTCLPLRRTPRIEGRDPGRRLGKAENLRHWLPHPHRNRLGELLTRKEKRSFLMTHTSVRTQMKELHCLTPLDRFIPEHLESEGQGVRQAVSFLRLSKSTYPPTN